MNASTTSTNRPPAVIDLFSSNQSPLTTPWSINRKTTTTCTRNITGKENIFSVPSVSKSCSRAVFSPSKPLARNVNKEYSINCSPRIATTKVPASLPRSDIKKPYARASHQPRLQPVTDEQNKSFLSNASSSNYQDSLARVLPERQGPPAKSLIQARLDASLVCSFCSSNHSFYLMYPMPASNEEESSIKNSSWLCSLCWSDTQLSEGGDSSDEGSLEGSTLSEPPTSTASPAKRHSLRRSHSPLQSTPSKEPTNGTIGPYLSRPPLDRSKTSSTIVLVDETKCNVQGCIDLLQAIEGELEVAALSLSEDGRNTVFASIRRELQIETFPQVHEWSDSEENNENMTSRLQQMEETVSTEMQLYETLWQEHWDRLSDSVRVLHTALESEGADLLLAYYQWRESQGPTADVPSWKAVADRALNKRDASSGRAPGQFWGASGHFSESRSLLDNLDQVEQLVTLRESRFFQLFVSSQRGLGWHSMQHQEWDDNTLEMAEEAAMDAETSVHCIVHTETKDEKLTQWECSAECRTLLVLVRDTLSSRRTTLSPPQKLNLPLIATANRTKAATKSHPSKTPAPNPVGKRAKNTAVIPARDQNDSTPGTPENMESYPIATFESPPVRKRAKRRCQRCIEYAGPNAACTTKCRGAKGRWGQTGCEYFTGKGKKLQVSL